MRQRHRPTYSLDEVKALIREEKVLIPETTWKRCQDLTGLPVKATRRFISNVILSLKTEDFVETATMRFGPQADIYKPFDPTYGDLYVKFHIADNTVVFVLSCHSG